MNNLKSNCLSNSLTFSLSLCSVLILSMSLSSLALAEKPEIMLVVDASSSMEQLQFGEGYPKACDWPRGGQDPHGQAGVGFSAQGGQPQDRLNLTRLHWAQWYLAGSVSGALKCVGHDANERDNHHHFGRDGFVPHYRLMCRNNNFVAPQQGLQNNSFEPCGADHGRFDNGWIQDPDANQQNIGYLSGNDGFIHSGSSQVLFGLMVSDSNPVNLNNEDQAPTANRNDYSYGEPSPSNLPPASNVRVTNSNVPALFSEMNGFAQGLYTSTARDPRSPWFEGSQNDQSFYLDGFKNKSLNLGIRGKNAPNGRFIIPQIGTKDEPNLEFANNDQLNIVRHNLWVGQTLRAIVPHGPSPLSAMLSDLREYYQNQPATCNTRLAVLVTDGAESTYLPTRRCNRDVNCNKQELSGKCVEVPQKARFSHEGFGTLADLAQFNGVNPQGNNGNANGIGNGNANGIGNGNGNGGGNGNANNNQGNMIEKVCAYPEGSPYESAVSIARQLKTELNVTVIVALVGHTNLETINYDPNQMSPEALYAYKIAEAGSPELGPKPGLPGLYNVESLGSAVDMINRIKANAGDVQRSETQPIVMAPGLGDAYAGNQPDPDLRQFRLSAAGFTPAQDVRNYSDVNEVIMGCSGVVNAARGLKVLDSLDMSKVLDKQSQRPVFTLNTVNNSTVNVVGGQNPLFNADGTNANNEYRKFIGPQSNSTIRKVGLQMQGYFGARGRTQQFEKLLRNYGGINKGDLVALAPTGTARENMGKASHYLQMRERPNLIFFGGDDGLIHAVRAFDGYNLFSFAPQTTWKHIVADEKVAVDGPLSAGEVIPCRSAGGGLDCPTGADAPVKSMLVGGVGTSGRELFAFELSQFPNNVLREREANINRWPDQAIMWSLTRNQESDLGFTVSRPALAHVAINGQVRGVAVVGCGLDVNDDLSYAENHGGVGRCLLFIDASTGQVLKKVEGSNSPQGFRYPVVGSPTVYPNDGTRAEVVYVGDLVGQFFRLDLTSDNPNQWDIKRIWPLDNPQGQQVDFGRGIGHAIYERPSLAKAENGDKVVVFATSEAKTDTVVGESISNTGYVVSLRERIEYSNNGLRQTVTEANWVMDFAADEFATGAPKIQNSTVFVTSSRPANVEICGGTQESKEGRLYGMHYSKVLDNSYYDDSGKRFLRVIPMIPRYKQGKRAENALSLILPAGRTAHGFSLVPTPSCSLGASSVTELVINLTEEIGAGPDLMINGLSVEYIEDEFIAGQVAQQGEQVGNNGVMNLKPSALNDALEVKMNGNLFTVSLSPGAGDQGGSLYSPISPFPSKVLYWSSGDED